MVTTDDTQQQDNARSEPNASPESGTNPGLKGLRASLIKDRESVLRWVEHAPLRLVAAALVDARRHTTSADLKSVLSPAVIEPQKWNRWWEVVRFGLGQSPIFTYDADKRAIRLRPYIASASDVYREPR